MVREFRVPADKLFEAWTKPEMMRKWLMTTADTNKSAKCEPHVGGTWEIISIREGKEYLATGRYVEVEPPVKLVFTFKMPQFSDAEDTITVEIKPNAQGCEMVFTQHIYVPHEDNWTEGDTLKAVQEFHDQSQHGWHYMFLGLKGLVEDGITPVIPKS
ncbi:SRPBCC domain-containing protein [Paenibacillus sp. 1011MAR3C5]|uniref:SRPBCC family protein n=1 Tax=Paenibacillus sp. 1011MAR3C5 TaxID=1675787 RepID=UPI000E6CCA30|nr:SRPBCC domain-containing protein [Paenibacillus sp. 1011MAR3C5]RJE83640.1 SRPBCC domain-containing protein [Paenibacillus sp. 1011MAR3C5]